MFYFIPHICTAAIAVVDVVVDDATTEVAEKQILLCYCLFYDCMDYFMLLSRADFDVDIKYERAKNDDGIGCEFEREIDDSFTHEKDFFHLALKNGSKPQGRKEKLSHRQQKEQTHRMKA